MQSFVPRTSPSVLDPGDVSASTYIITHVFCPLQLPGADDYNIHNDHSLAGAISAAALRYSAYLSKADIIQWNSIARALENIQAIVQSESLDRLQIISRFGGMGVGDILALPIRAQNAGVVFRKQNDVTIFESFEISPMDEDVVATEGKLICSYPGPAIEIPSDVFNDKNFLSELVNFLVHMNSDALRPASNLKPSDSKGIVHPRYITDLLTGILRSVGRPANITRISKRVGDDVVSNNSKSSPWRRSSLWLLIRVTLQTALGRSPLGHYTYKKFMLFFMCCLVGENICANLSSDLLHWMSAKISRRLRKLGSSAPEWLSGAALEACTFLRSIIEDRWKQVQAAQPAWTPLRLNLAQDVLLSLLNSEKYIRDSLGNHGARHPVNSFHPNHPPRCSLDDLLNSDEKLFEEAYRIEPHVALYDVECAVEKGIDGWINRVTDGNEACVHLETLAHRYSSRALTIYANKPELLSVMLLTTIELWVALDKVAIREIPILADYSPEIPTRLLEKLLFSKAVSFNRLHLAHEYLSRRHSQSRSQWSVFSTAITTESFAVRFFRTSAHLQHLKTRIEEVARLMVHNKATELQEMNARHAELRNREAVAGTQLDNMSIAVHEWPLPASDLEAEVVVLELDCPVSFDMWRSATFNLLVDLCSPSAEKAVPHLKLSDFRPLSPYLVKHPRSRITLGSDSRGSDSSPRVPIPAKREKVCINNRLRFSAFDARTGLPIAKVLGRTDIRAHCTYKLPSGPYHNLQKYVGSTSHTSNQVIANQADCHKDLSIHEYMAFGHLRSGDLLQWLNILRELRARSLTFRHPEVHILLAQAVAQVGPLGSTGLKWHREIQDPVFCGALLGELRSLVRDVESNWQEAVTMDTISLVLRRLLVSSPGEAVTQEIVGLLRTVRRKVFSWVQELLTQLATVPGDDTSRMVLPDTAAICRSTFDVDPSVIPKVLHSTEDIEILLACAMMIHDNMPSQASTLPAYSQLLLDRDRRLSLALEHVISDAIQSDSSGEGINNAIHRLWCNYYPGSKWTQLKASNSRWVFSTTAPPAGQRPQTVHFNVLDGSLFVDGKPLGTWLPDEYVRHPLFKLILGKQMLKVTQSDLPGMNYSTRGVISDHQVSFSLGNDSDLVIRAKRRRRDADDSDVIQLIPHEKLIGDLPTAFIEGHAHWLNLSTLTVEIRPLDTLWDSSPGNWRIDCTPGDYCMWKGDQFLVDIRSQAWGMVSSLLRPLGAAQDLIVTVSPLESGRSTSLQLSVVLPRYDLSFYIDEDGDLQSRNIRGMVYDEDQSIGTLFGLVNRLVLRPKTRDVNVAELVPRCVIIPDGDVSFRVDGHHVCVEITTPSSVKRITYQTYRVNTDLGCLTGNSTLTSKLYCAYLHSLTNGCSADPLTGRSGTEEALSVLLSAECCSNLRLTPRDAELLRLIASICYSPVRNPANESVQEVELPSLPAYSQTYGLYVLSKAIKERYERAQVFYSRKSSSLFAKFPSDETCLKRRVRVAYLFQSENPFQRSGPDSDVQYSARDLSTEDSREHHAYTAATCVYRRTGAGTLRDIWRMLRSWKEVSGDTDWSLQYNKSWLAPDLPLIWLKTYDLLRASDEKKWFQLLFSLPAMAYASPDHGDLVPMLVAFASQPQFRLEDPPSYDSYPISAGYQPSLDILRGYVIECAHPFERSPEHSERAEDSESRYDLKQRQLRLYDNRRRSDAEIAANGLLAAWPCKTPPSCSLSPDLYDVEKLASKFEQYFFDRFRNLKFREHLTRVQQILNDLNSTAFPRASAFRYSFQPSQTTPSRAPWKVLADQLFTRPAPSLPVCDKLPRYAAPAGNTKKSHSHPASLCQLITAARANAVSKFQRQYVSALHTSAEHLGSELVSHEAMILPTAKVLVDHYTMCRGSYTEALQRLQRCLGPETPSERAIEQGGQWPRRTAHALIQLLASNSPTKLRNDWKRCLTRLTLLVLEVQRARRLLLLYCGNHPEEFCRELQNEGCDGWKAETHPDWLLIQLQGNFLIRRVQAEVANAMMSPRWGSNTAMQLNMGEGKTSVIVPIVAAALANGTQLVRVIVPKPLTTHTLHVLADRLGGLTNRRLYHLPFSRSLVVNTERIASLRQIMLECMQERGILVIQPEHVLSLKLLSVERQLPGEADSRLARPLLDLQRWLHSNARDILDEIDEILDVRSQLTFTIGHQQRVEGCPERWITTQQILGIVSKYAPSLRELFPLGVEYEPGSSGSFPYLRILQEDAGQKLVSWIVRDVMEGLLPNFNFGQLEPDLKDGIERFISHQDVLPAVVQRVRSYSRRSPLWGGLLLLRGLLVNGIILYAFRERRWRVDYGLCLTRTMLAVPYRAKDVPAPRADFGHPDISIVFTCLSYYYAGLNGEQLRKCFEILAKQQDPSLDYGFWVGDYSGVPDFLWTFTGINLESVEQWNKYVFPLFSRNRAAVDFYLARVVFPREAKEFPSKLPSSGWDLAEKKERLVTGFSGTNDGQYLLPLPITQHDPDHQRGTNAKVLSYLLRPENKHYMCVAQENGERLSTREFLKILVTQKPVIRVLLDVGAQMLDLRNHEVAKAWLETAPSVAAAIYFNEDDELTVRTRDDSTELLRSSPFAQQLDQCIIYLDDAHTRGTDIKFPDGFRAAVTLGPKVVKDRLVQGCMRMRELGHSQSVMFFAPPEVDRRIRSVSGKAALDVIENVDILQWAIQETWEYIQRWAPHWAIQGMNHTSRYTAWTNFCNGKVTSAELAAKWLRPEAKKLEDLYVPRSALKPIFTNANIRQRCADLGVVSLYSAGMDEEQERELVYEPGGEPRVTRPPRVPPAGHSISQRVVEFVKTGAIQTQATSSSGQAFKPAFNTLDKTSAAIRNPCIWSQSVLTTADFERTVQVSGKIDNYLRPVHWIVSAKRGSSDVFVIISPYEANALLPHIRSSKSVHLHLYTPRTTKSMKPCDDLTLYSIPMAPSEWAPHPSFMEHLNVFSGQLYLKDYKTYAWLCHFLVVYAGGGQADEHPQIRLAHTISSRSNAALRALMDLRCRGGDFTSTHMGKILYGRLLHRGDFDFDSKPLASNDDRLRVEFEFDHCMALSGC